MKKIGVVTVGRSDWGIYLPVVQALRDDPSLEMKIIASGMHLSSQYGLTVEGIEKSGFQVAEQVMMLLSSDSPEAVVKSMGMGLIGFSDVFRRYQPDLLLVLGDRFEMYCGALAALPFKIPVAHLHGGEITLGAIDDSIRHSITKLSHLHFTSTKEYARRVIQMGEEPWRVTVSGAPSLDNLKTMTILSPAELSGRLGMDVSTPYLLVTFHPVTLEYEQTQYQIDELLGALQGVELPLVVTAANADTGNQEINVALKKFVAGRKNAGFYQNLGTQVYFSLMAHAAAMVGNSSSGIIEAPSFKLPVVNIGSRQGGRVRAANVIDVGYSRDEIRDGIREAISKEFRDQILGLENPYFHGNAAQIILEKIKTTPLGDRLIKKYFYDVPGQWGM